MKDSNYYREMAYEALNVETDIQPYLSVVELEITKASKEGSFRAIVGTEGVFLDIVDKVTVVLRGKGFKVGSHAIYNIPRTVTSKSTGGRLDIDW